MEKSNQPPFWLQVKEDYIFDNFDGLIRGVITLIMKRRLIV